MNPVDEIIGKVIECNHCGFTWITKSKMVLVSCPSCLKKVHIRDRYNGDWLIQ